MNERSERLLYRILAGLIGVGGTVFNLLAAGAAMSQASVMRPVFADSTTGLLFLLPILLGLISFWAPIRVMKWVAGTHAVVFAIAVVLWIPVASASHVPYSDTPWLVAISAVPEAMAAIAWPTAAAWIFTAFTSIGVVYLVGASEPHLDLVLALENGLYSTLTGVIFVGLMQVTLRLGREVGKATASARREAARAARIQATNTERARFNALIHDDVIATLLAAGRGVGVSEPVLKEQAETTLRKLAAQSKDELRTEPYGEQEFIALMRSVVSGTTSGVAFSAKLVGSLDISPAVASALGEALGEALRNSVRHAVPADGRQLAISVDILEHDDTLTVTVNDNGQGFSMRRVAPTRLGIAVSIRQRMAGLEGGLSRIRSGPSGTEVTLGWRQQ
jgi:signal transduction histidine kinase